MATLRPYFRLVGCRSRRSWRAVGIRILFSADKLLFTPDAGYLLTLLREFQTTAVLVLNAAILKKNVFGLSRNSDVDGVSGVDGNIREGGR